MNIKIENDVITLELNGTTHSMTRAQARMIANKLIAAANEQEDYLSLKAGDTLYYIDKEEGICETAIIVSIHIDENNTVQDFSAEFPESNDFDEFYGSALGHSFFIDKDLAEHMLKRV